MDKKTFFQMNKTGKNQLMIFVKDWMLLSRQKFDKLNNISFVYSGTEYRIINNLVLKV